MKKILLGLLVFLIVPFCVNAASLLTNLNVEGIGDLNLSRRKWNLTLTSSLDYTNITATALDGVTIEGNGKVALQEGDNQVVVKATDANGETEDYTINIKLIKKSANETNNPETGAFLSIGGILVLACLAIGILKLKKNKFYKI